MAISELSSIGKFVSGGAVLVSIVYLALQVRQAQKNQRALMQQGRAARICDLLLRIADPSVAGTQLKALSGEELSAVELFQFEGMFRAQMAHRMDSFLQHQEGLLHKEAFERDIKSTRQFMANAGARAMWRLLRDHYPPVYRRFVDEIVRETPVRGAVDDLSQWRAAVAHELEAG